jgi:CRISPR-associated protein Cmr3
MSANSTSYYYVRPTDSLFVRGNAAFGDSGEHGASMMPPPPSLFAGAFRSALLGKDAAQLAAFVSHGQCSNPALAQCLGTPTAPGSFRITWLSLAGETSPVNTAATTVEAIAPLPADLLMLGKEFVTLAPRALPDGVQSAGDLPLRATLVSAKQEKPTGGKYLRGKGLVQHLQGHPADKTNSVDSQQIYQRDPRLGIGLNADARTAEEGLIYTTEGFAFSPKDDKAAAVFTSTGFLVGLEGVADLLPDTGLLRLGGDGRSAQYHKVAFTAPTVANLPGAKKQFRLLLQTPALFSQGWLPEGVAEQGGNYRLQGDGFSARLACAALGRREVVSGWDLHAWAPKPAQAAVPAGSVYWFDEFAGDAGKLAAWVAKGLWPDDLNPLQQTRRAEGYNRALLAAWS